MLDNVSVVSADTAVPEPLFAVSVLIFLALVLTAKGSGLGNLHDPNQDAVRIAQG
jgi:hypothetical protein